MIGADSITLAEPRWLLLIILAIPLTVIAALSFRSMTRPRVIVAIAIRTVLITLAALLLAGPASIRTIDRLAVIAVVDVSESAQAFGQFRTGSLRGDVDSFLREASLTRGPDDLFGVIAIDGAVRVVQSPSTTPVAELDLAASGVDGTRLGEAIRRAESLIPPDASGRIVVLSDGNATDGVEARSIPRGIPVDVVPLQFRSGSEVVLESLIAPRTVEPDSMVTLRATIRSSTGTTGILRASREGEAVDLNGTAPGTGRQITVPAGRSVHFIEVALGNERLHRFEASFSPDERAADQVAENNRAEAFALAPGPGRMLVIDGSIAAGADPSSRLAEILLASGASVDQVAPSDAPRSLVEWQAYDLVVLDNVPADTLDETTQEHLKAYVRDFGGGLVMTGGRQSFGAGGWRGAPIEPLLPVMLELPESVVIPEVAIVFVLDRSGPCPGPSSVHRGPSRTSPTRRPRVPRLRSRAMIWSP